ncbi:MAG TPA: hypothetical protein ENH87_16590 [Pricia antarctica]|uniref:Uncharacterized protein n=2 Tax=root TaxID=1 RepID=A0A831VWK7_9FLAO|nr:hypothetical protein [Pricia antarctica]
MKNPSILYLILFFIGPVSLLAQKNPKSIKEKSNTKTSYVLTDLSYVNDAVFMGRRDSIAAPYILPSIGYYDKSGLFADATLSYLVGSEENRVDLFLTTAGYLFNTNNWSGGISGTAYFYNQSSYNVQSEIVGDITGLLSYDLKMFELTLSASTYFSNNSSTDFFGGLLLNHAFYNSVQNFKVNPSISIYAGSQYFYQEYFSTSRLGNRKGKGNGSVTTETSEVTTVEIAEASKFKILNVALSLPLQYQYGSFIYSATPVLAIPQTSATITTSEGVLSEDLKSAFYFSVGISYWFYTQNK